MLFSYDKTLGTVETSQGTMTLTKVFIPFFLEMFLMNFMQTVNTFMLSYFSDNAVAAVGAAGQFSSMIYTILFTPSLERVSPLFYAIILAQEKKNRPQKLYFQRLSLVLP